MTKYRVYDLYEGEYEFLGVYETRKEAQKRIKEQAEYTDGECDCIIKKGESK